MRANKRPTADVPEDLLLDAQKNQKNGANEILVSVPGNESATEKNCRTSVYEKAQRLRGRLLLDIDIEQIRERCRS